MPVVVSDTSPIRALAHLGQLAWLEKMFQQVVLPPAVGQELNRPPSTLSPIDVRSFSFLKVQAPTQLTRYELFSMPVKQRRSLWLRKFKRT